MKQDLIEAPERITRAEERFGWPDAVITGNLHGVSHASFPSGAHLLGDNCNVLEEGTRAICALMNERPGAFGRCPEGADSKGFFPVCKERRKK